MIKSGIVYSYGMGFWGPNGHDGIWHIAIIESLSKGAWAMPIYAGESIRNYHIGFDLLVAILHKISFIPVSTLYFQIIPPIMAIGIGIFSYMFVYEWTRSKLQSFWSIFFIYFGGSFGWIVNLFRGQEIGGESMFWAQQSISTLINPPFALSLLVLFSGLYFLLLGRRSDDKKKLFLATILFGLLIQIKVYAGILLLAGLFAGAFWDIIKGRGITLFKVASGALIVSILIFVPVNGLSYSTLVFQPFWFLETMMAVSDRFYWPKFAEALMNYRLGGVYIKLILGYALAFLIFWYGNLGTRIFKEKKVWDWVRNYKKLESTEVIVITIIVVGIAFPLLFIQQGTPWNTIQFLYYSLMFSGIVAGIAFGELLSKNKNAIMFPSSILLIFLTIPTTLGTLNQYLPSRPPAKLSILELQALTFLSKENDGVVLTYPFNPIAARIAEANPPRPLYLYESSAYVSAFSKKDVFLEDEVNLNITGYDWLERRQEVEVFYNSLDEEFSYKFLRDNNISYIYWLKGQRARLGEDQLGIEKIFENEEVEIYRVESGEVSLK
jgi:hypothetical protein